MARRSREAVQKRLRERRRAEKSEQKRLKRLARKQGIVEGAEGEDAETQDVETQETATEAANAEQVTPIGEAVPAKPEETP
jgi:hypothetical protein